MVSASSSNQVTTSKTEDSRVAATDKAIAVGRGSTVNISGVDDKAYAVLEGATDLVRYLGDGVLANAAQTERAAFDFASSAGVRSQNDITEIAKELVSKGVPLAALAFIAVRVWGK